MAAVAVVDRMTDVNVIPYIQDNVLFKFFKLGSKFPPQRYSSEKHIVSYFIFEQTPRLYRDSSPNCSLSPRPDSLSALKLIQWHSQEFSTKLRLQKRGWNGEGCTPP